ncbi:MAG TPA: hypothetical protein VE988_27895 [Gemmataceae bacterium]|nr:hypothetical protein [Gemmataceae bacterium]
MRTIADSAGAAVGFVADVKPQTSRWLRWLSPRTLEVYETPDQSLVFTLRRGWGWLTAWHLVDADDRLVGTFRGRALLDGFGHFLAVIEPPDDLGCGRFLAVEGRELGEYALEPHQTKVTFAAELEGNPFARMLLLGAVLVRQA